MDENKNTLKHIGLQFFAEKGGTENPGSDGGAGGSGGEDNPGTQGAGGEGTGGESGKTFTQSDVNAMLKREKEAAKKALLKELGMEDVKSAKDGLAKYKEILEKDKTDGQKATEALSTSEQARKEAEAKAALAEAKVEILSAGCNPDYLEDVITLAMARVTEDKDVKAVVADMKKDAKYAAFFNPSGDHGTGGGSGYQRQGGGGEPGALGKRLAGKTQDQKNPYFD